MIVKRNGKYIVLSHDGKRKFGTYDNEKQARKRLQQMEMFKHLKDDINLSSVLSYLSEELKDIPASADNIHYTLLEYLYGILKDGRLKGASYYSIKTFKNEKKNPELCTVRSTRSKELNSSDRTKLSTSASGPVKIRLFTKRILSSVHGVKKAPIAELPISSAKDIKYYKNKFKDLFGIDCPIIATKGNLVKFSKFESRRKGDKYQEDAYNRLIAKLKKIGLDKKEDAVEIAIRLNNSICDNFADLRNRESEERFIFNSENGIPIRPELVSIEILDGWEDEFDEFYDRLPDPEETCKTFYDLISRYENCFVKNQNFKHLKKTLEDCLVKKQGVN